MNPTISCSVGNVSIIPGFAYSARKSNSLTRISLSRSSVKHGSSTLRFIFPSLVVSGVFPQNKRICSFHKKSRTSISATGTEVSVEEPGSPVADEVPGETPSDEVGTSEDLSSNSDSNPAPAKAKRSRPIRKSEMPPVKNEDLVPGATFMGKVKSIQPFGAFVDFGAFTDGLVHISMLSDDFVKDVANVVSVGQEVKVKLLEVNTETQRISLTMRENVDTGKQREDAPVNAEKAGPGRRNTSKPGGKRDGMKKSTRFVEGQELEGTVKNMTRSGAFITLPEGEEGFLPVSEEPDDGFGNVMGNTSLEVGQKVNIRVLRITRGQATLTMKKEVDVAELDSPLDQGVVHAATNPFVLAFRKNKDISAFLDEREKIQSEVKKSSTTGTLEKINETDKQGETNPDVQGEPQSIENLTDDVASAVTNNAEDVISENEEAVVASSLDGSATTGIDSATEKETEVASGSLALEGDLSSVNPVIEEAIQTDVTTSNVADENVTENGIDQIVVEDEKQSETSNEKEEFAAATLTDGGAAEPSPDTGSDITSSATAPQETAGSVFSISLSFCLSVSFVLTI